MNEAEYEREVRKAAGELLKDKAIRKHDKKPPQFVKWSWNKDIDGKKMVQICGNHFPQPMARQIAHEILELLSDQEIAAWMEKLRSHD